MLVADVLDNSSCKKGQGKEGEGGGVDGCIALSWAGVARCMYMSVRLLLQIRRKRVHKEFGVFGAKTILCAR
jgi:hypothetical protein